MPRGAQHLGSSEDLAVGHRHDRSNEGPPGPRTCEYSDKGALGDEAEDVTEGRSLEACLAPGEP